MPVLGHAFVGLAIGVSTQPCTAGRVEPPGVWAASALWLPSVVTLAYVPDIIAQLGLMAGWSGGRLLGHSVIFAVAVSPAIAALLMRLGSVSFLRAYVISLASLLVHDVLDLAQATDRAPWWPMSNRSVAFDLALIPTDVPGEMALFGGLFLAFLVVRQAARRLVGRHAEGPSVFAQPQSPRAWWGRGFILAVVLGAVLTHSFRDAREADFETGRTLIRWQAYQHALEALARAERWPSTAKAGRIDYLRAEAYAGLGDRRRAESYYLRAYRADPTYFWAVADLALFYVSSSESVADRRRLVAPYLNRLRSEFARHPALPGILAHVEGKLVAAPGAAERSDTRPGTTHPR